MAKSVPTAAVLPALGELQPGQRVLASTWRDIVALSHYTYGRQGAHIMNAVFDPEWRSLDFSSGGNAYHAVSGSTANAGMMELDEVSAIFAFSRLIYGTTATTQTYSLAMSAYAQNLNVRATVVRLDTEDGNTGSVTSFTNMVTSHGADSEWNTDTEEFTKAQASRGGSTANGLAYFLVYLEALVPASGTGRIHQVALRETPITSAAAIPRGA